MFPHPPKQYVIIVHHGPQQQLDQALNALWEGKTEPAHIIVVDHGAEPMKENKHPKTTITRPKSNNGYAAGIKQGLKELKKHPVAPKDCVIVMNSDVRVHPNTVADLRRWWQRNPENALVGIPVREKNEKTTGKGWVNLWTGRTEYHDADGTAEASKESPWHIPYIHGACFSATYEVFEQMKELPEDYFLYWEDVHMSTHMRKNKVPLRTVATMHVEHGDNKTTTMREQQQYYLVRNGAYYLEKHAPQPWRAVWWLKNRGRLVFHALSKSRNNEIVQEALKDAIQGKRGKKE